MSRCVTNRNLTIVQGSQWNERPLLTNSDGFIEQYLQRIWQTLQSASNESSRVCVMLGYLRYPNPDKTPPLNARFDHAAISRFTASLKAQLDADVQRKAKVGRVHPHRGQYIWTKEQDLSVNPHFNVALIVNRDAYFTFGNFNTEHFDLRIEGPAQNMYERFCRAWGSALNIYPEEAKALIHIPDNAVYYIDRNSLQYQDQLNEVFKRLSYFSKLDSKIFGNHSQHCNYGRL